jgi:molecular chaperone GrpE
LHPYGATRRGAARGPVARLSVFVAPEIMTAPDQPTTDDPTTVPPEGATAAAEAGSDATGTDDLQRQLDEQRDKYLRLAAEYDNHRRRTQKERAEAGGRAQAELVKHLIDALDDLGRFAHVDPASTDATTVVEGVAMVEKKLLKTLNGAGLEVVDPTGQPFDPAVHEAVATEPASSRDDDHQVARVFQLGYVFGGQLLRPARVVVKQYGG